MYVCTCTRMYFYKIFLNKKLSQKTGEEKRNTLKKLKKVPSPPPPRPLPASTQNPPPKNKHNLPPPHPS